MPDFKDSSRKDIAEALFRSVRKFFKVHNPRRTQITFREVHLAPNLRADILNLSWDDKVVILEIKSCRADFKTDLKYHKYLDYCDYFYFYCPEGEIPIKDVPKNVGLIYASGPMENPFLKIVKRPTKLKPSRLNGAWFRAIYKRLAFRKMVMLDGKPFSIEESNLF